LAPLFAAGAATAAPAAQPGGVVLDGFGGLHPFGGATVNMAAAPYWPGWDVARGATVRPDGSGGWTLDSFGGIHAWGNAQAVASPGYWPGWDIARDMVMTSRGADGQVDGRQGYLLDGFGGIRQWGGAPALSGPYPGTDVARSLVVDLDTSGTPDGGWVLYSDDSLHAFGAASAKPAPIVPAGKPLWSKMRGTASDGYAVGHWGTVQVWGQVRPYWAGYSDWGIWDIQRDIALLRTDNTQAPGQPQSTAAAAISAAARKPSGGVSLDGMGGLRTFGDTAVNVKGAPYWPGWDIARAVQAREDGSGGWTLDGFGGIHAWGTAPSIATPAYWNWSIARSFVVTSRSSGIADGAAGYLLDGFGGLHPWGGAPTIGAPPYVNGFDIYRGLAVHTNSTGTPDGGWAMDEVGRTYAFGAAPSIGDATPYAGRPMYHAMHQTNFGWYSVASDGAVVSFDGGYVHPAWTNWVDWGTWDIVRDVALINPTDPQVSPQPLSSAAAGGFSSGINGLYLLNVPMTKQLHPLDCEAATLQMVLAGRGTSVSQDAELAYWGADLRPAVKDSAGNIVQWGDPYTAFVGNVNASEWNATGYGIYYPPLVRYAQAVGHYAIGQEQWSVARLFDLVVSGYPAAVEGSFNMQYATPRTYTAWDGRTVQYILNNHVFALIGINFGTQQVIINDPYTATQKTYSWADFTRSFTYINNMATVVS
jgi:uncharacterized protein YvpB